MGKKTFAQNFNVEICIMNHFLELIGTRAVHLQSDLKNLLDQKDLE